MLPRALELFDLAKLPRYRDKVLILDSRRALTHGNPLRAASFLAYLNPTRRIYTGIVENGNEEILGGVVQDAEEHFARLAYLAPADISTDSPLALIEHLTKQAGAWKAHQLVAEIEEDNPLFQSLRQCGFSVYSRQRRSGSDLYSKFTTRACSANLTASGKIHGFIRRDDYSGRKTINLFGHHRWSPRYLSSPLDPPERRASA